jgi:hypothetical protein
MAALVEPLPGEELREALQQQLVAVALEFCSALGEQGGYSKTHPASLPKFCTRNRHSRTSAWSGSTRLCFCLSS